MLKDTKSSKSIDPAMDNVNASKNSNFLSAKPFFGYSD